MPESMDERIAREKREKYEASDEYKQLQADKAAAGALDRLLCSEALHAPGDGKEDGIVHERHDEQLVERRALDRPVE